MTQDYSSVSTSDLNRMYFDKFGEFFFLRWDDFGDHREEIIACLESGIPQNDNVSSTKKGVKE